MKKQYIKLSFVLMTILISQQLTAQQVYVSNSQQYDVSDYLDLEAVASVFAQSRNIDDFENRLNDYRNQVSNLDLNNDGYVDYLRLVKLYDRNAHVILIQAVLGNNYYQDVATVVVGRDAYNRDYIQFIGDSYLYGDDYILEPIFQNRPRIVSWLWSNPNRVYVSKYYWGYYPRYYRLRPMLPMHHYFNHVRVFVNVHHRYYYVSNLRFPVYVDVIRHHRRNDYWTNHNDRRFDQRNRDYRNKGHFQHNQDRRKPNPAERNVRQSENERRQSGSGVTTPQRDTRTNPSTSRPSTQQREIRVIPPKNAPVSPQRDTRVTQPRNPQVTTPQRESRPAPSRESRVAPATRETKVTPKAETKVTPKRESRPAPTRTAPARDTKKDAEDSKTTNSGRR
jgi:hypothetical protein